MWWSSARAVTGRPPAAARRRLLVGSAAVPGLLLLAGCGFRPLYAGPQGEAVAEELAAIEVRAPLTRLGRILESQLRDDLNPAGLSVARLWRLDLGLQQSRRALAIQLDDSITRYDLTLAAFFTLRELDEAAPAPGDGGHAIDRGDDTRLALPDVAELPPGDPLTELEAEAAAESERPGTLYRSAVRRVATYNVISDPFATLIAEQDAERRAAVEVSREIRTLLTLFFENAAA
jgi:LPS-assembly lipoprotein